MHSNFIFVEHIKVFPETNIALVLIFDIMSFSIDIDKTKL